MPIALYSESLQKYQDYFVKYVELCSLKKNILTTVSSFVGTHVLTEINTRRNDGYIVYIQRFNNTFSCWKPSRGDSSIYVESENITFR